MCHDLRVRDVLVVLFWLWVLIAVGVYGYRVWRRATQGPRSQRQAAEQGPASAGGGLLSRSTPPPLPDGPIEARLPRALQDQTPPPTAPTGEPATGEATSSASDAAVTPPRTPTVAEAVRGIRMPENLLPVIDPADTDIDRIARFSGPGTTVERVTAELTEELRRLGFDVDGLETATPARAGLTATRDDATVAATITYDDDSTAVLVELSV